MDSFQIEINFLKKKIIQEYCKCQTVWIQIRRNIVGPDLVPNCLQKLLAEGTSRQRDRLYKRNKKIDFFSQPKHMLWVLKITVSMRRFF